MWRSCSFTFDQLGNYALAMDFLQLDTGSVWSSSNLIRHYIREGKLAQAKEVAKKLKDNLSQGYALMGVCLENPSSPELAGFVRQAVAVRLADPDPEPRYVVGGDLLFCGQKDAAVQLVKSSIAGKFCPYDGLQNDSVSTKLRGTPEFAELLSSAKQCRDHFISQRSRGAQ